MTPKEVLTRKADQIDDLRRTRSRGLRGTGESLDVVAHALRLIRDYYDPETLEQLAAILGEEVHA